MRTSSIAVGYIKILSIMIPMDTVKTRLVTQTAQPGVVPYKGVLRTLSRIVKEEGVGPIYRSLTPRLVSVVPMIGIQVRGCRPSLMRMSGASPCSATCCTRSLFTAPVYLAVAAKVSNHSHMRRSWNIR